MNFPESHCQTCGIRIGSEGHDPTCPGEDSDQRLVRLYRIPKIDYAVSQTFKELGIKREGVSGNLHQLTFPDVDALITFEALRQGVFQTNAKLSDQP